MTDEQIKVAPMSLALMENLSDVWAAAIPEVCYTQATQQIIKALQSDGQYIVFQAPSGYKFAAPKVMTEETLFPGFYAHSHEVIPIPAKVTCAGMESTWLEPLTGGVE